MMRMALSPAALGLLRALIARAGVERDRILLTDWQSTDWQSLTFTGERHRIELRFSGPESAAIARRVIDRIGEDEFTIRGQIVADIAVVGSPEHAGDGSTIVRIEALTIAE